MTQQQLEIAKQGYDLLLSKASMPGPTQYPGTMPLGAGNRWWGRQLRPFYPTPDTSSVQTGDNGNLEFLGD